MKKQNYSRTAYEQYLNELYTDIYSAEQAADELCYLNKGKIRASTIYTHHANHTLGTLVRKYDPVGFNAGYNDWKR